MLRFNKPSLTKAVRTYTTATSGQNVSSGSDTSVSTKALREKTIAEAVAREEAAQAKAKLLIELKHTSKDLISKLNKTPNDLIKSRLAKLTADLSKVDPEKVKNLDQQLEEFMISQMKLPVDEISNRPWADLSTTKKTLGPGNSTKEQGSGSLKSTASSSILETYPYLKPTPDHHEYSTQELYLRHLNHTRHSGSLGSKKSNIYIAKNEVKTPKSISDISIASLLAAGCHLGHAKAMWRPSTQPFIYGEYDGIHVIDLNETLVALRRAVNIIKGVANKGGIILYVGTAGEWEQHRALEEASKRSRGYYVSRKWIPGTITNFTQVTQQKGEQRVELDMTDTPLARDLRETDGLLKPDLVVIMNPVDNRNCVNECIKSRIPTIGLCDTDMEPSLLTYPIPSNDDSMRVSSLMLGVLSRAASEGVQERVNIVRAAKASKSRN